MFLAPPNAGLNVIGRFTVNVLPALAVVTDAIAIVHWLFCSVPPPATVADCQALPASFSR